MTRRRAGFTLAETLVVLVVIGLLMAVVPPLLTRGVPSLQLKSAVRDVVSGLRLARGEAVRRGEPAELELDLRNAELRVPAAGKTRSLSGDLAFEATAAAADWADDGVSVFRFFPDGSATGGNIRISARDLAYRVTVDWLTGRVHVADDG